MGQQARRLIYFATISVLIWTMLLVGEKDVGLTLGLMIGEQRYGEIFVRVLIVPSKDFTQNDEEILLKNLRERLGSEIKIIIQQVEAIPRTKLGKYKLVISKVH